MDNDTNEQNMMIQLQFGIPSFDHSGQVTDIIFKQQRWSQGQRYPNSLEVRNNQRSGLLVSHFIMKDKEMSTHKT